MAEAAADAPPLEEVADATEDESSLAEAAEEEVEALLPGGTTRRVTAASDQSVWYSVMPLKRKGSLTLMRLLRPGWPCKGERWDWGVQGH